MRLEAGLGNACRAAIATLLNRQKPMGSDGTCVMAGWPDRAKRILELAADHRVGGGDRRARGPQRRPPAMRIQARYRRPANNNLVFRRNTRRRTAVYCRAPSSPPSAGPGNRDGRAVLADAIHRGGQLLPGGSVSNHYHVRETVRIRFSVKRGAGAPLPPPPSSHRHASFC